jgi:1-deoxy-D-xylulose-5-phosphate reductoisomerase
VSAFLANRIGFLDIAAIVEATLASCDCGKPEGLPHILAIDAGARRTAHALIGARPAAAAAGI